MPTPEDHFRSVFTTPFRGPGVADLLEDDTAGRDGGNYAANLGEAPVDLSTGDDPQKAAAAAVMDQRIKDALAQVGTSPAAHFARARSLSFQLPRLTQRAGGVVARYRLEPDNPISEEAATQSVGDPGTAAIIANLQASIACLVTMITGASIAAVCNGDGTVTITLTWGGSPC